jgi:hypothetical protein
MFASGTPLVLHRESLHELVGGCWEAIFLHLSSLLSFFFLLPATKNAWDQKYLRFGISGMFIYI